MDHDWNAYCTDLNAGAGGSVKKRTERQFADQTRLTLHDKNDDQTIEFKQYLGKTQSIDRSRDDRRLGNPLRSNTRSSVKQSEAGRPTIRCASSERRAERCARL